MNACMAVDHTQQQATGPRATKLTAAATQNRVKKAMKDMGDPVE